MDLNHYVLVTLTEYGAMVLNDSKKDDDTYKEGDNYLAPLWEVIATFAPYVGRGKAFVFNELRRAAGYDYEAICKAVEAHWEVCPIKSCKKCDRKCSYMYDFIDKMNGIMK